MDAVEALVAAIAVIFFVVNGIAQMVKEARKAQDAEARRQAARKKTASQPLGQKPLVPASSGPRPARPPGAPPRPRSPLVQAKDVVVQPLAPRRPALSPVSSPPRRTESPRVPPRLPRRLSPPPMPPLLSDAVPQNTEDSFNRLEKEIASVLARQAVESESGGSPDLYSPAEPVVTEDPFLEETDSSHPLRASLAFHKEDMRKALVYSIILGPPRSARSWPSMRVMDRR